MEVCRKKKGKRKEVRGTYLYGSDKDCNMVMVQLRLYGGISLSHSLVLPTYDRRVYW